MKELHKFLIGGLVILVLSIACLYFVTEIKKPKNSYNETGILKESESYDLSDAIKMED